MIEHTNRLSHQSSQAAAVTAAGQRYAAARSTDH